MGLRTALGLRNKKPPQIIETPTPTVEPPPLHENSNRWFANKEFTTDWISWNGRYWPSLPNIIGRPVSSILEVGSWEGRSAIVWLNLFPDSHLTCIDAWDLLGFDGMAANEGRFDRNMAEYSGRFTKIKSISYDGLEAILARRASYDLIYVDAFHSREATLANTMLSWPMLREGGVLIWDDYLWEQHRELKDRPIEAIDWFLETYADQIEVVHRAYQIAIRRLSKSPMQNEID